jgi:hypothetical protein
MSWCANICPDGKVDLASALSVGSISAGLLAISVGIFAFVPVLIELALQRTASADIAVRRSHRAFRSLDILLGSVFLLGISVVCATILVPIRDCRLYLIELTTACLGDVTLLLGVTALGLSLRNLRAA